MADLKKPEEETEAERDKCLGQVTLPRGPVDPATGKPKKPDGK